MQTETMINSPIKIESETLLSEILGRIRPELPIQNPMPFFVHNNPLQHWEKFPFAEGIERAILTYENAQEDQSRILWRELEDFVIPLVLSYFDQGLNRWVSAEHKQGLWNWFCDYIDASFELKAAALVQLKKQIQFLRTESQSTVITHYLSHVVQNQSDWENYLRTLIFHFKGWSGMVQVLERNPHLFPLEGAPCALMDWVAILVTSAWALGGPFAAGNRPIWNFKYLEPRKKSIQKTLNDIKRTEVEYYRKTLSRLQTNIVSKNQQNAIETQKSTPDVQVLFCIDDREESLRRALESVDSNCDTYGTVGFFGVDFSLKRPGHVIFQPQCPPVIQPRKTAEEIHVYKNVNLLASVRKSLPYLNESRFTFIEPILALIMWPFYALALLMRSFSPGFYAFIRSWLRLDHYLDGENIIKFIDDYTLDEKVTIVADILGGAGLVEVKSKLVVVLGHAATTTNNPFQKSYGCGACSGQSGFSNAKVFAEFANSPVIRKKLIAKNIRISEGTQFIAACHDTCSDEIHYATLPSLSLSQNEAFKRFKASMALALAKNKNERWRQFSLPKEQQATSRSADWSQPRPEYGHTGVALSVFGPRWLTKDLDLGRQSFLISYEPDSDPDGKNLAYDILSALPVCANINLDYFTSSAFPKAMGAGSKLPLNIASGIGLMPGSKGDLRIGLATQMIDRHEPKRLLAFVYADAQKLESVIKGSPRLTSIIKNNWIHLVRIDPTTLRFEAITEEIRNELALIQ